MAINTSITYFRGSKYNAIHHLSIGRRKKILALAFVLRTLILEGILEEKSSQVFEIKNIIFFLLITTKIATIEKRAQSLKWLLIYYNKEFSMI